MYRIFNEVGIACYVMFDFDRDNADTERVRESKELLTLVGAATVDSPTADVVEERFAYFVNTWEDSLAAEIPDYGELRERARKVLGIKNDGKPLIARYIARELTRRSPAVIPPTVERIIKAAVKAERSSSCLRRKAAVEVEAKPATA